ncbi:BrnA antitoxin family protein [Mycobacterium sp. KBS0706]|uniref:BrnA antitoxin family protein n=1 Tax=Mycobacterium sp. KBS0706 TaxID=2578109 RepID=UPI00110FD2D9|nr:BrnA antitoxin family protein [Mycobacterium sp. KBS0706]TSD89084.1 BrnA antitoxin family protein [Mycobacterium sp. KBS0706]
MSKRKPNHVSQEAWDAVDSPPLSDKMLARMRPATETHPGLVAEQRRTRGPQKTPTKELVSIRLDRDLLTRLRAQGEGWQRMANETLRRAVGLTAAATGAAVVLRSAAGKHSAKAVAGSALTQSSGKKRDGRHPASDTARTGGTANTMTGKTRKK